MRTTPIQTRFAVFGLLSLIAAAGPAPSPAVEPGETIEFQWMGGTEQYAYFSGSQGEYVGILLLDKNNEPYYRPLLQLRHESGGLVASVLDERAAFIRNHRLARDGVYQVTVGGGAPSGLIYDCVFSFVKTGDPNDGGDLSYGTVLNGSISPVGDIDGFRFAAQSGDKVTLTVEDTQNVDGFRPFVDLLGPGGLIAHASGDQTASVGEQTLSAAGDYSLFVWGGGPDWGGGAYQLTLIDAGSVPTPTPTPLPLPLPELRFQTADAGPAAPARLQAGQPLVLGAFVENAGQPAGPFWLEFWGSRTGGLTLDEFLTDSIYVPGVPLLGTYPYEGSRPLYSVPDGPYTVVMVLDRNGMVNEWDETNNRAVIGGKRILALRPYQDVDLVVRNFFIGPQPLQSGRPMWVGGTVENAGTVDSGFFWIEFWWSPPGVFPVPGGLITDSIPVNNLPPGGQIDLLYYPRTAYAMPPGNGHAGVIVDRPDSVNETDETNNYIFVRDVTFENTAAQAMRMPEPEAATLATSAENGFSDIVVVGGSVHPTAPTELQPGQILWIEATLANQGPDPTGPFWLEFWGSRTGGLTLDVFLADSFPMAGLAPGQTQQISLARNLYPIPDGPYTAVFAADRPRQVPDSNPLNNRLALPGGKLLTIRPMTQANLVVEEFDIVSSPTVQRGGLIVFSGQVRNTGVQTVGQAWIEFWVSADQVYPGLNWFLCDSIYVGSLPPGHAIDLADHSRIAYWSIPTGVFAIGCFADATDLVNETDESDNYQFRPGAWIYDFGTAPPAGP